MIGDNKTLEPYTGFESFPEITTEQAFSESADAELIQAANDFDEVVSGLNQFAADTIRPERIALTQMQTGLRGIAESELDRGENRVRKLFGELISLGDAELIQIGQALDNSRSGIRDGIYIGPPIVGVPSPPAGNGQPIKCVLDWGRIYGPCWQGLCLDDYCRIGSDIGGNLGIGFNFTPAFPGACYGFANDGTLWVREWQSSTPQLFTHYTVGQTNSATGLCGAGTPSPPKPLPEPEPSPEPEPVPIPGIQELCECLTKLLDKDKAINVWQRCDTCEILVLEDGEFPPDSEEGDEEEITAARSPSTIDVKKRAWQIVVTIVGKQITTLPLKCFLPEPGPEPGPKPEPGKEDFGIKAPPCNLPKTLVLGADAINRLFVPGKKPGPFNISGLLADLTGGLLFKIPFFKDAISAVFTILAKIAGITGNLWKISGCDDASVPDFLGARLVLSLFERFLPGQFQEQVARLTQAINERCPSLVPTVEQASAARWANLITDEEWACYTRANGFVAEKLRPTFQASLTRPGVADIVTLFRRGVIDRPQFDLRLKNVGVDDIGHRNDFFALSEQRPPLTDIIRFMVRDVDDPAIVNKFALDTDFGAKFGRQLKQWAADQGIPEIIAQYAWRAHWSIPSPTQLFEMYHRLGRNSDGSSIPQFRTDIEDALKQQDILPFWIPKLLAVSESLMTRVDIRRAYKVGVLTKPQVKEQFVRRGYSTADADALTDFSEIERNRSVEIDPLVKRFAAGELNERQLRQHFARIRTAPDAINNAVTRGNLIAEMDKKKQCLAAVRHKIMLGEINYIEAVTETTTITGDPNQATTLVTKWICERNSKSKTATASQLCQFFSDGLIDSADFMRRLLNIGYEATVASELVRRCQIQLNRKLSKLETARLAKIESDNKRREKERKQAEKEREGEQRQTEAAREKAAVKRESRQKILLEAAKLLTPKSGFPIEAVYARIRRTFNLYVRNGLARADKIAADSKIVAGSVDVLTLEDWENALLVVLAEGQPD